MPIHSPPLPGIKDAVDAIAMVDTHEHLEEEPQRLAATVDFGKLFRGYVLHDLISAGLHPDGAAEVVGDGHDIDRKWRLLAPYWEFVRHTGYGESLLRTARSLYGVDDLNEATYRELSDLMRAANKPGVYERIIKEKAGIEICHLDNITHVYRDESDSSLFLQDMRVGIFLTAGRDRALSEFELKAGIEARSLQDWLKIIDWYFDTYGRRAVAVKNTSSYWRTNRFERPDEIAAADVFRRAFIQRESVSAGEWKAFQDFTFHHIIKRCIDFALPIKLHTGYHAGNNKMDLAWTQPADYDNLFREYPQARFVIFHIGYPYTGAVLALAKHYANVYADMCWAWIMDPVETAEFLRRFIATVPSNKLFAFGGDYGFADNVVGHAEMAREGVSAVLSEHVRAGRFGVDEAARLARRFLRENAYECFDMERKLGPVARALDRRG